MRNTLVIDFKDELLAMEGLDENSFSMIYLPAPQELRNEQAAKSVPRPRVSRRQSREARARAFQEYKEQKRVAAGHEYATYISHLVEASYKLLIENGTLCFVVRSRMSDLCNYQMILESFFCSVAQISVELRGPRVFTGIPDHIIIYCCRKEKDVFFEGLKEPAPIDTFNLTDENGRRYRRSTLMRPDPNSSRLNLHYEWMGIVPRDGLSWCYTKEGLLEQHEAGNVEIVGNRAFKKVYHDESFVQVPSTWNNETRPGQMISVANMDRLLSMFTLPGQSAFCPFEHDGVFSYCANRGRLHWLSFYSPFDERRSLISDIPDEDYELSEDFNTESTAEYSSVVKSAAELTNLSNKIKDLQNIVDSIQRSLGIEGASEEDVVASISERIEELLTESDIESCIPEVREWLAPHWSQLEPESKRFLPTGAFFRNLLESQGDAGIDYTPAMIEYCKALETELFSKLFKEYVRDLIDSRVDVRREFPDDFDKRSDSYVFASFVFRCIRYDRHRPYKWRFELGKMAHVLTEVLQGSDLRGIYADYRGFLEEAFESGFFGSDFSDRLTEVAALRNECAHRSMMLQDKAELTRELIRKKLSSILAYYN